MSAKAHEWRRTLDELQGNNTVSTRQEAMTGTQASALSGATTGFLLSCAFCKLQIIASNTSITFYLVTAFSFSWLIECGAKTYIYSGTSTFCVGRGTGWWKPQINWKIILIVLHVDQKIKFSWEINVQYSVQVIRLVMSHAPFSRQDFVISLQRHVVFSLPIWMASNLLLPRSDVHTWKLQPELWKSTMFYLCSWCFACWLHVLK